jgi:hypothetical protein
MTAKLSKAVAAVCAATAMTGYAAGAHATVLLDLVNVPVQVETPYSFTINATSSVTSLTIEGYDLTAIEGVKSETLQHNGTGANLLGLTWLYTAAASGSESAQFDLGTGVNALGFGGVVVGDFDSYTQEIATTAGASYTLQFLFSLAAPRGATELRVTTNADLAAIDPAGGGGNGGGNSVPEPASWALMLLGFGALGATLRQGRRTARTQAA